MSAKELILERFENGELSALTLPQICKQLNIPYRERNRLASLLDELCKDGKIFLDDLGRYGTAKSLGLIEGKVQGNERGFAFLVPTDTQTYDSDFFIPRRRLHGALHGDSVLCTKTYGAEGDEVSVVKILERGLSTVVGIFRRDRRAGYLIPDEKRFCTEIYIPLDKCFNIQNGVKAVAKITSYPQGKAPGGEIIEVLGDADDFYAEELSIIRSYNLREEFPAHVEKEAKKQEQRGIGDISNRTDFRQDCIVTIDGADTRDIDDAISLKYENERYVLGVHIADVSHYVEHRSPLDAEAYARATSVYFPDCVLPMLPRALSNGICSLNENQDRLTLSCVMEIDSKGNVKKSEIVEGVIRSRHKMTYDEVEAILHGNEFVTKKYADIKETVFLFAELTRILQQKREKKGGVTLDIKEAKILFDKDTEEITIPDYKRMFSHEIIEAFMVLANETVAQYMQSIEAPFIYRVHEKPAEEKAKAFRAFAQTLGLNARFNTDDVKPYDYQKLLKSAEELPAYPVLNRTMLRSMQKARYDTENLGHFGLASDCYCHFTSPIRRYPDLCIHRVIKEILHGGYETAQKRYGEFVKDAAKQSSLKERLSADAERDVDDLYKAMYMSERIGETYDAVISGVTAYGLFAELTNTVEGFIPVQTLQGTYVFDEAHFALRSPKETFTLGQRIFIKVVGVDFDRRRTEFRLLSTLE